MFRFTIRDVLWLTVVTALAVGWWVDRNAITARSDAKIAEVQRAAEEAAKRSQIEVLDWKFRTESVQKFLERHGGKVVFRTGKTGRQEVVVQQDIWTEAFFDPRLEIEQLLKARAAVARAAAAKTATPATPTP